MNLDTYDVVNVQAYTDKLSILSNTPNSIKLPKYIKNIIHTHKLLEIDDVDERAKFFIQLMYRQKLRGTTITRYFNVLKPILFKGSSIVPNSMVFDRIAILSPQMRGVNFDLVDKMIKYIIDLPEINIYKWSILIAFYTGLRSSEILQFKASHILSLLKRDAIISITRKNNVEWKVVYYTEFINFIVRLRNAFIKECDFYETNKVDILLFPISSQIMHFKIKQYYRDANNGELPPCGFGFHIFRYYIGSKLALTNKLDIAQRFLGHKHQKTTEKYIRYNNVQKQEELNSINNKSNFYYNINRQLTENLN